MKKCAVVIGVNKTGDLPILNAAVSGAKEFAGWAEKQNFEVALLTDENNQPVTLGNIKAAIRNFVQQATFSQMIIFFAGHGMLRGPDFEVWLLSGAPTDADEAVNVLGSILLARDSGIPHITIISDACRSRPDTLQFSRVNGGVIFPNDGFRKPRPEMDVFYATLPGDPALEKSIKEVNERGYGIFTECLLKGLNGSVPGVIEELKETLPTRWVIPAWKLKPYLEQAVPDAAASIAIQLQQDPDIRVESHPPNYLAEMLTAPTAPASGTAQEAISKGLKPYHISLKDIFNGLKSIAYFAKDVAIPIELRTLAQDTGVVSAMQRIIEAKGRVGFETRTGFTIVGSEVIRARATGTSCDLFKEANAVQIRVHEASDNSAAKSILIQLANGYGVVLAILPGFIGAIVVENERVVNVNYTPSRGTPKYAEYEKVADQLEQRRAFAAVATRHGSFRLEDDQPLGLLNSFDPTLSLYTAYAYAQSGAGEEVAAIYSLMSLEPEPIPFDIALLAQHLPESKRAHNDGRVAPFCPMLTQGWAFLDRELLPDVVNQAGHYLIPGLWTMFQPEGFDLLWSAVEKGEII